MSFCVFGADRLPRGRVEASFLLRPDLVTVITGFGIVNDHKESKMQLRRGRAHLCMQFCDLVWCASEREMVCRGCLKR